MENHVVGVLGTFDTKGREYDFLIKAIQKAGAKTLSIDAGILEEPYFQPDISREQVAQAGGGDICSLASKKERGSAVKIMTAGARETLVQLYRQGRIQGIISLGGTAGATIGTSAMRALPIGFPKMMISTVASGDTRPYVQEKDIIMFHSVVDIAGINRISSAILINAANAIAGMVTGPENSLPEEKPLIVASMFGVTTPCVTAAKDYLEGAGFEVLVFHATGSGGRAMEALIASGLVDGVLDVTTTEWCDELVGGVLSAGPGRLDAAATNGIPQVVSVGALDMVNFGPPETVPAQFSHRCFYQHNETVTLMRTTLEENAALGKIIGGKLSKSKAPCVLFLPLEGVSMIDKRGQPFYGPAEDKALFDCLLESCDPGAVEAVTLQRHINDTEFALAMAKKLEEMIKTRRTV